MGPLYNQTVFQVMECFNVSPTVQDCSNSQMFDTTSNTSAPVSHLTFANIQDHDIYATTSAPQNPNSVLPRAPAPSIFSRVPAGTRVVSNPDDPICCLSTDSRQGVKTCEAKLVRSLQPVNGKYYCPFACGRLYSGRHRLTVHIKRIHTKTARVS